jgi:hypothetical protein
MIKNPIVVIIIPIKIFSAVIKATPEDIKPIDIPKSASIVIV